MERELNGDGCQEDDGCSRCRGKWNVYQSSISQAHPWFDDMPCIGNGTTGIHGSAICIPICLMPSLNSKQITSPFYYRKFIY